MWRARSRYSPTTKACSDPAHADTAALKSAYNDTSDAWAKVEFVRIGPAATALRADRFNWWLDRTGATAKAYHAHSYNRFSMDEFLRPLEQTAHLCGMEWETPFVVHGASVKDDTALKAEAERYKARVASLLPKSVEA